MPITPKENYMMLLRGEIPEYIPATYIQPVANVIVEDQIAPTACPNGPITTVYGVTYVGSEDLFNGALPMPGQILLDDITKWRDVIKNPDNSHRDWEGYYKKQLDTFDRENKIVRVHGGDYFLTLVSFMGFEGALIAMYQEPEEVYALFDYLCSFYESVTEKCIDYYKPDIVQLTDDIAAWAMPFVSPEQYRALIKPFQERDAKFGNDRGLPIAMHCCGKCEMFIDDWISFGVRYWDPPQTSNDLVAVQKKFGNQIILEGCFDILGELISESCTEETFKDAVRQAIDTYSKDAIFVFNHWLFGDPDNELFNQRNRWMTEVVEDYGLHCYGGRG